MNSLLSIALHRWPHAKEKRYLIPSCYLICFSCFFPNSCVLLSRSLSDSKYSTVRVYRHVATAFPSFGSVKHPLSDECYDRCFNKRKLWMWFLLVVLMNSRSKHRNAVSWFRITFNNFLSDCPFCNLPPLPPPIVFFLPIALFSHSVWFFLVKGSLLLSSECLVKNRSCVFWCFLVPSRANSMKVLYS